MDEQAQVSAQDVFQGAGRPAAHAFILVAEQVQHLGAGELATIERKTQGRHGLVEQAYPGGAPGDLFFVQQLLRLVGKLVWAEDTYVA